MSTQTHAVPLDLDRLSTDDLKCIIRFADGEGELSPHIPKEGVTSQVVKESFGILEELGVIGYRPSSHYDGASA